MYNKIDKELLSLIRALWSLKGEKEIIFSKSETNRILINSYKVWEKGENSDITEEYYDIKIFELIKGALLGVSS